MTPSPAPRPIATEFAAQAAVMGDRPAIEFAGSKQSYAELDRRVSRIANALIAQGVRPGERVCVLAKNSGGFIEATLGIVRAGAVATPINWRLSPAEVAYVVSDAGARLVFCQSRFRSLLDLCDGAVRPIDLDTELDDWIADHAADDPCVPMQVDDVALQLYTSGTTGKPKGAMLTHRNAYKAANLRSPCKPEWLQVSPDDRSLIAIPMFHVGGLESALRALLNGALCVMLADFTADGVIEALRVSRPTIIGIVPTCLQMMLEHPDAERIDYSCINYLFYGASPIASVLLRRAMAVMSCGFVQCYGMTETCGTALYLSPADHDLARPELLKAAGREGPGSEVRIVDGAGRELEAGEVGEILLRGAYVTAGYWGLPEATAAAIDRDGWLHTGDAGFVDAEGYLYVHDRVKDMIISGGENVYPAEVEEVLFAHDDIVDAAVIGVPDEKWGEAVKAVVVARPGRVIDADEVIRWTKTRIASFKAPKSIDIADELPKGPSGKTLRRVLMEPYWREHSRRNP